MNAYIRIKELIYLATMRIPTMLWGRYVRHNLVKVHWGRGLRNFGDCLQPDTLRHYGLTPVYVPSMAKSDIIMAGSILQSLNSDFQGYIIGTGGDRQIYSFPDSKILAVRGELTKNCLTPPVNNCLIGDCGLLTKLLYPKDVKKRYRIGIVPHFVDLNNEAIKRLKAEYPEEILIISPLQKPSLVVEQIKSCRHVLSSSLHGLIVADSFGIPSRRWVDRHTMPDIEFHDYKFHDYYSSIGIKHTPVELNGDENIAELESFTHEAPKQQIETLIIQLDKCMREFARHIISAK